MKLAIDTNAYRALDDGDKTFADLVSRCDDLGLPVIVLGEIRVSITLGSRKEANAVRLAGFLEAQQVSVLTVDEQTTMYYATLFAQLRAQGTPIPANDIWIAALCLQHGYLLATRDSDFKHIQALQTIGDAS